LAGVISFAAVQLGGTPSPGYLSQKSIKKIAKAILKL